MMLLQNGVLTFVLTLFGATNIVAESIIVQPNSQSKLATMRRKNQKIRNENEIEKANKHAT
jgi:hypothetical protein